MSNKTPLNTLSNDILQSMPEALVVADLQGIIQRWNPGAENVFGFTAAEAVGQSLDLIIPERMRKAHWEGFNKAIERGGTLPGRTSAITRAIHKSGEPFYVDMSFAMVKDQAGKLIGAMAVARDATKRFQEEKELRRQLAELALKSAS